MHRIVVATQNSKKLIEFTDLLRAGGCDWLELAPLPPGIELEETGDTFEENSRQKATQAASATGEWALADDSGLAVDALNGAPGVYSARFAGVGASDAQNREKLLSRMQDVEDPRRTAHFVCQLTLVDPAGEVRLTARGECHGAILREERGDGGFGYDPLFWVPDLKQTFAEIPLTEKSSLSHRGRAFRNLLPNLKETLGG